MINTNLEFARTSWTPPPPPALNPALFTALEREYGEVRVSNRGQAAILDLTRSWSGLNLRCVAKYRGGEHYSVCCPSCGDRRFRLQFSYRWGTQCEATGQPLLHLIHCKNEDCIRKRDQQQAIYRQLFGNAPPVEVQAAGQPDSTIAAAPPVPVALPKETVPLAELSASHPAIAYIRSRRFDAQTLTNLWSVGYCERDPTANPAISQRLIVPLVNEGSVVGWIARSLGPEVDSPKYLFASGMVKSRFLYGLSTAKSKGGPVTLVEGVTDVWRIGPGAVACLGKVLSPNQTQLFTNHLCGREIVIAFDADATDDARGARRSVKQARQALGDEARVVIARLPEDVGDIGDCLPEQAEAVITNALQKRPKISAPTITKESIYQTKPQAWKEEIDQPVIEISEKMTRRGIAIDWPLVADLSKQIDDLISSQEGSTTTKSLEVDRFTESPRSAYLRSLGAQRPGQLDSMRNNLRGIAAAKCKETLRVHPTVSVVTTETGRMGFSSPALDSLNGLLRDIVIAGPDTRFVEADYSLFEFRVLAELSSDPALKSVLAAGVDLHAETAAAVLEKKAEALTPAERKIGKSVNFGMLYGMTPIGLSHELGVSESVATEYIETFFERFQGVRDWSLNLRNSAMDAGYVETFFGRRRDLPNIRSADRITRERGLRQAGNTVIQGTAADLFKMALTRLSSNLNEGFELVLTVHDAVLLSVPAGCEATAAAQVREIMEELPLGFSQDLPVTISTGERWGSLMELP